MAEQHPPPGRSRGRSPVAWKEKYDRRSVNKPPGEMVIG
jgi:hypothetical protein